MYLFLDSLKMPQKSRRFLHKLHQSLERSGVKCKISFKYECCDALVLYGLGGADRYRVGMDHIEAGKPLLSFDIGYWSRKLPNRKYRFSLNGLHPSMVMVCKHSGPGRFLESKLVIETIKTKKNGPIMLVGNAPKSIAVGAQDWTARTSKEIREQFPDRQIVYRPKPKRPVEHDVVCDRVSSGPIESELKNISLVVCRHSNVAVDACFLGIPVVCTDGAAAGIYPNLLSDYYRQPDAATRVEFLHRLAYWQWGAYEVKQFWQWFFETFPSYDYR